MRERHHKQELSAFVNHELSKADQQLVAEHLLLCADCRQEHDAIRLGAGLASRMKRSEAPARVWNRIDGTLDGHQPDQASYAGRSGTRLRTGYAIGLLCFVGLIGAAYFAFFRSEPAREIGRTPGASAWELDTMSGQPRVDGALGANHLAVGESLETDAASRARLEVANIGTVEIQPNSLVKLVGTNSKEHRLSLERGALEAQIVAPPRLFIVDTPSAVAVDLGCAYKLEVDDDGNSYLHVTSGFVALERGGRESIVPAGAKCLTRHGKGLGTPYSARTTDEFREALESFDFANGGIAAVERMLETRTSNDIVTLWHLLSRVRRGDREKVFDALAEYVQPPSIVTRKGIMELDQSMLVAWRAEVERVWFDRS